MLEIMPAEMEATVVGVTVVGVEEIVVAEVEVTVEMTKFYVSISFVLHSCVTLFFGDTVKLGYSELLGTDHICTL
jgi:hypothetical protein